MNFFLPKHELFKKSNRKIITLFNVTAVEINLALEIEPAVEMSLLNVTAVEIETAVFIEPAV